MPKPRSLAYREWRSLGAVFVKCQRDTPGAVRGSWQLLSLVVLVTASVMASVSHASQILSPGANQNQNLTPDTYGFGAYHSPNSSFTDTWNFSLGRKAISGSGPRASTSASASSSCWISTICSSPSTARHSHPANGWMRCWIRVPTSSMSPARPMASSAEHTGKTQRVGGPSAADIDSIRQRIAAVGRPAMAPWRKGDR